MAESGSSGLEEKLAGLSAGGGEEPQQLSKKCAFSSRTQPAFLLIVFFSSVVWLLFNMSFVAGAVPRRGRRKGRSRRRSAG